MDLDQLELHSECVQKLANIDTANLLVDLGLATNAGFSGGEALARLEDIAKQRVNG